ncbi:MAG: substrate-binding domain-containing protein [Chthoniobacteraceae bacterium]
MMRISQPFLRSLHLMLASAAIVASNTSASAEPIAIQGHVTLTKGLADNGSAFRDAGLEIRVEPGRGAASAIDAVGEKQVDIGVLSRSITAQEKAKYPTRRFFEYVVAVQAYVPSVARNVWDSGVKSITKEQMRKIFEGEVTQWSEIGGDAGEIKLFLPEPGSPGLELLTTWIYGDPRKAPEGSGEVVRGAARLTRNSIEFTGGSIGMLPPALADGKEVFQLGIGDAKGKVVQALEDNLLDRSYPLARPIFFLYGDRPTRQPRELLDFVRSREGKVVLISADLTPVTPKDTP